MEEDAALRHRGGKQDKKNKPTPSSHDASTQIADASLSTLMAKSSSSLSDKKGLDNSGTVGSHNLRNKKLIIWLTNMFAPHYDHGSPDQFGASDGPQIANYDTVLEDINEALGFQRDKQPALVYAFVESKKPAGWWGQVTSGGHCVVAYTLPDDVEPVVEKDVHGGYEGQGRRVLVNVAAQDPAMLVSFLDIRQYFFGTHTFKGKTGNEQGGIYNRSYCMIRVEEAPADMIKAIHRTFMGLKDQNENGTAGFFLTGGRFANFFTHLWPFASVTLRLGNCIAWVSEAFVHGGLVRYQSLFPKAVWAYILEDQTKLKADNVKVIYMREIDKTSHKLYPGVFFNSPASLLEWVRTWYYWRLEPFADVIVQVDPKTRKAVATKQRNPRRPPTNDLWRYHHVLVHAGVALLWMWLFCSTWTGCGWVAFWAAVVFFALR